MARSRVAVLAFAAALGVALAGVSTAPADAQPQTGRAPFSAGEASRLRSGALVQRPEIRREGSYQYVGGTSWQRVRAPRDDVWAAVLDVRNYRNLIPAVSEARLVESRGRRRLLWLRHQVSMTSAAYFARARVDEGAHTIYFQLDRSRPHDVRAGRGFLTVDPYRGDESIVTWGVMADPGLGVLTALIGPAIQDWILRVPSCVRAYVERHSRAC